MGGALTTALIIAVFSVVALRPPMPRHSSPFNLQFAVTWLLNEQPVLGLWWLLAGTLGTLRHPQPEAGWWWLVAAASTIDVLLLARLAVRARSVRPALTEAFERDLGRVPRFTRPPWWRIVLVPIIAWRPDVRRIRNRHYGPARRGNRLDLYVSRRGPRSDSPVLVYLHGGGFRMGSKLLGGRPLLHRLAARGWVCVSVDYRLFGVEYSDQLEDARRALAWVRNNAADHGGSPDRIFVAGGSAGAHLAATAALSGSEVAAVIGLYGYYGSAGSSDRGPTSPLDCLNRAAPPFLVVHGALDTLVLRRDAREFAERLRAVSGKPVVYAELPGTQHNFDFFHSIRSDAVVDAVAGFADFVGLGHAADTEEGQRRDVPLR